MFYCEICSDWMDCWNDCENCEVWLEENGEDADKPERGKRAEMGMYDDAWIYGDDGIEMIAPSPGLLHDKITAERYNKIIDELNSLGCTSFIIMSEQIKSLLNRKDGD